MRGLETVYERPFASSEPPRRPSSYYPYAAVRATNNNSSGDTRRGNNDDDDDLEQGAIRSSVRRAESWTSSLPGVDLEHGAPDSDTFAMVCGLVICLLFLVLLGYAASYPYRYYYYPSEPSAPRYTTTDGAWGVPFAP